MAEQAQEKAREVTEQAQEKVQQTAGQVQGRLREQLGERSSQLGEQIGGQASDLHSVAQSLREQGKEAPADAAERLAGYAERAGSYMREQDPESMLADVERFGRSRPWAVAAGGLAAGFLASRFLKASSRQRYQGLTVSRPAGVFAGNGTAGVHDGPSAAHPTGAGAGTSPGAATARRV